MFRRRCLVRTCHRKRANGITKWCQDHTDAIMAGGSTDPGNEKAIRLGTRRWALLAEVEVEREWAHVPVMEDILLQDPGAREFNRVCWDKRRYPLVPFDLGERVDELLELVS